MQGRNVIEKFGKSRRKQRETMHSEGGNDQNRKRNKVQRGNDHWTQVDSTE